MGLCRNTLSTVFCWLLITSSTLCLCTPVNAEHPTPAEHASHHGDHEAAAGLDENSGHWCQDCELSVLGASADQDLAAAGNTPRDPNAPEALSVALALGPDSPPIPLLIGYPNPSPTLRPADTPLRRWDLLLD